MCQGDVNLWKGCVHATPSISICWCWRATVIIVLFCHLAIVLLRPVIIFALSSLLFKQQTLGKKWTPQKLEEKHSGLAIVSQVFAGFKHKYSVGFVKEKESQKKSCKGLSRKVSSHNDLLHSGTAGRWDIFAWGCYLGESDGGCVKAHREAGNIWGLCQGEDDVGWYRRQLNTSPSTILGPIHAAQHMISHWKRVTVECNKTALQLCYMLWTESKPTSNMLIDLKNKQVHQRTQRNPEVKHHLVWSSQDVLQKTGPVSWEHEHTPLSDLRVINHPWYEVKL